MNWLTFTAATLACFRLTRLITDDKIMDWFRRDVPKVMPRKAKAKVKEGIKCPFCVSWWVCNILVLLLWASGIIAWGEVWLWQPAIWGGSVLWNQVFVRLSK